MTQKKFSILIFINLLIFLFNAYNNISISLCDRINQKLKFSIFHSIFLLKKNYFNLKEYYSGVKELNYKLQKLEDENKFLKAKLLLKNNKNSNIEIKFISANVIANSNSFDEDAVFVDAGINSGVSEGSGVISDKGVVGVVVKSYTNYSKVLLLTDIRFSVDVLIPKKHAKGLLLGNGKRLCRVKYLPINVKFDIGDKVVTGGFDGIFPNNIPVGEVIGIKKNNLYKVCIVKPFINRDKLDKVFILRK